MNLFFNKQIFLTRTEEDNLEFQKCFKSLNPKYKSSEIFISAPLLKICLKKIKNKSFKEDNLIFTSRYGIRALSQMTEMKLKTVFCVGESTAKSALDYGFTDIHFPKVGKVSNLVKLISSIGDKKNKNFRYFRGKEVSFDLKKQITNLGFEINETIIYEQKETSLSYEQKKNIYDGKIGGIVFFSAKVAENFCRDIKKVSDNFLFFCISDRVVDAIIKYKIEGKYKIRIAEAPNIISIVNLISKEILLSENYFREDLNE